VVLRAADPYRRSEERIDPIGHETSQVVSQQHLGSQRHVWAVLHGRAERDHDRIATRRELGLDLRPGQTIKLHRSHARSSPLTRVSLWGGCGPPCSSLTGSRSPAAAVMS
jgi:hypothetical protein